MLRFYRTNQLGANFLLIIYVIVLRLSIFIYPTPWEPGSRGVFSYGVYSWVGSLGWLPDLIACVLVFIQAVLLCVLAGRFRIHREVTLYPGVFYILLTASVPDFLHLSPVLMGNTFLILGIMNLFSCYKKSSSAGAIFNTGFWFGVAALFYFSNIVFVLLGLSGLYILRSFRLNEVLTIFIGAIVPFFLTATLYFLINDLSGFYQSQFLDNWAVLDFEWSGHWSHYAILGLYTFLLLIVIFSINLYFQKQKIQSQKYIRILYNFFAVAALTIFFQKGIRMEHLMLVATPFALLLPFNFLQPKKQAGPSTVHLFWFFLVLGGQFYILSILRAG